MSKTAANPFIENEFTKYFDVSKVMEMPKAFQDFKMPNGFNMETLMDSQRKNMQAFATAQQTAAEGWQTIMRRQSETMREAMKECSSMMSEIMGSSTPEEKIAKQAQMAKAALDRSMCCGKEFAEMATKAHYDALEVISNRIGECVEEMRAMGRSSSGASAPTIVVGKVANK